ncbi:MAG: hypothetical protein ACRCWJ_23055, partial [Casimicrobium sp.]
MRMILLAIIAASTTRYMASESYCTFSSDTPANTLFDGRLVDCIYERAVTFPVWNRAGAEQPISYVEFVNNDGELDSWLSENWKDVRVTLKLVEQRALYSTATQVGTVVVDRIEAPAKDKIRLVCRSLFERLEAVITRTFANTIGNEAMRGRPQPLTVGVIEWTDSYITEANDASSFTRGFHAVADDFYVGIEELRQRGAGCVPAVSWLATGSDYFETQGPEGYGYRFREPTARHAVSMIGQYRRESALNSNSEFDSGLTGWTVTTSGGSSITAGGGTLSLNGFASTCIIEQSVSTVSGRRYAIDVAGITTNTATIEITVGGSGVRAATDLIGGRIQAHFIGTGSPVAIGVQIPASATGTVTVGSVSCYLVNDIAKLTELVRFAAVDRGTLSTGDLDLTSFGAIDTARGYAVAWHNNGGEARGIDLVSLTCQSFGVSIYQDANGKLKPVEFKAPSGTPDFVLDEIDISEIGYEFDEAPGLSKRMNYGRNYAPHTVDDMAGLPPNSSSNILLRGRLSAEIQTVTTTVSLAAQYADAADRAPLDSILGGSSDAQEEIDRVCGVYDTPRAFYPVSAVVSGVSAYTI